MSELVRRAQPLLGTFVEITVPQAYSAAIDEAFSAIRNVHSLMSFHEGASDIGRINRAIIGDPITCDRQTIEVITLACRLFDETDGLFDICVAPRLVRDGFLPANPALSLKLFSGNSSDIEIIDKTSLRLRRRVMIDLGGIAKGYAVDRAIDALEQAGVPLAMVNAGGDLRFYGEDPWPVQLRNADGSMGEEISLSNCAIASSANRLTRKRRVTGLVTPHIGAKRRPIRIDQTITTVASHCVMADAMTKIAMIDPALANDLLAHQGGYVLDANHNAIGQNTAGQDDPTQRAND